MNNKLNQINWQKILIFLSLTFSQSWMVALLLYFFKIEFSSVTFLFIVGLFYMSAPAVATFITQKFIYKGSFIDYGWTFSFKNLKSYLKISLIFIAMILFTMFFIYIFGNLNIIHVFGKIDFSAGNFNQNIAELIAKKNNSQINELPEIPIHPFLIFMVMLLLGTIAGGLINIPVVFGEEFGWRGLLLQETLPLGFLKSSLFIGIIWGIWHLPLVYMGLNYPNYPILGMLMMTIFTIFISPIFSYVCIKSKSIIAPCLFHGMINGTSTIFILFTNGYNELYSSLTGLAGILSIFTIFIFIALTDKSILKP